MVVFSTFLSMASRDIRCPRRWVPGALVAKLDVLMGLTHNEPSVHMDVEEKLSIAPLPLVPPLSASEPFAEWDPGFVLPPRDWSDRIEANVTTGVESHGVASARALYDQFHNTDDGGDSSAEPEGTVMLTTEDQKAIRHIHMMAVSKADGDPPAPKKGSLRTYRRVTNSYHNCRRRGTNAENGLHAAILRKFNDDHMQQTPDAFVQISPDEVSDFTCNQLRASPRGEDVYGEPSTREVYRVIEEPDEEQVLEVGKVPVPPPDARANVVGQEAAQKYMASHPFGFIESVDPMQTKFAGGELVSCVPYSAVVPNIVVPNFDRPTAVSLYNDCSNSLAASVKTYLQKINEESEERVEARYQIIAAAIARGSQHSFKSPTYVDTTHLRANVPELPRAIEEFCMRAPLSYGERQCSLGKQCEGMFVSKKGMGFVLVSMRSAMSTLRSLSDVSELVMAATQQDACILCHRKMVQLHVAIAKSTVRKDMGPNMVASMWINIVCRDGEYMPWDCEMPGSSQNDGLVGPFARHNTHNYVDATMTLSGETLMCYQQLFRKPSMISDVNF